MNTGNITDAKDAFQKALSKNENSAAAMVGMGWIHMDEKNNKWFDKALACSDQDLEVNIFMTKGSVW